MAHTLPVGQIYPDRLGQTSTTEQRTQKVRAAQLAYAGEPNMFAGSLSLAGAPEGSRIFIVATDPARENFGRSQEILIN